MYLVEDYVKCIHTAATCFLVYAFLAWALGFVFFVFVFFWTTIIEAFQQLLHPYIICLFSNSIYLWVVLGFFFLLLQFLFFLGSIFPHRYSTYFWFSSCLDFFRIKHTWSLRKAFHVEEMNCKKSNTRDDWDISCENYLLLFYDSVS